MFAEQWVQAVGTCFLNSEEVKAYIWNRDIAGRGE